MCPMGVMGKELGIEGKAARGENEWEAEGVQDIGDDRVFHRTVLLQGDRREVQQ